jgi:hypothetical protein
MCEQYHPIRPARGIIRGITGCASCRSADRTYVIFDRYSVSTSRLMDEPIPLFLAGLLLL